jgi:hypothetical protein
LESPATAVAAVVEDRHPLAVAAVVVVRRWGQGQKALDPSVESAFFRRLLQQKALRYTKSTA